MIEEDQEPYDDHGHGTKVTSVICGTDIGIVPHASYEPIRAANRDIRSEETDEQAIKPFEITLQKAIEYCITKKCDIINVSIGTRRYDALVESIVKDAYDTGILIVAAAGNGYIGPFFPATFGEPVIAVGGMKTNGDRYAPTNSWPTTDILAPAEDILVAGMKEEGKRYVLGSGTSYAAAIITEVLAWL